MEKTELAKAYVQIIPSAKGIGGMLQNEVGGETDAAGKSLGGRIGGAIKVAVIAAGKSHFCVNQRRCRTRAKHRRNRNTI